jgi:glycogen debranching enzyme
MSGNLVKILDGNTFVVSDDRGDIEASPTDPTGLFSFDTRFLSRWVLTIDGERLNALSTDDIHYFETRFFLVPGTGTVYVDSKLSVIRRRAVGHGFHEELQILNHDEQPVKLKVRLEAACDFADLFEVKDALKKQGTYRTKTNGGKLELSYERETYKRATVISSSTPAKIGSDGLTFDVAIEPHGEWSTELDVATAYLGWGELRQEPTRNGNRRSHMQANLDKWLDGAPRIECDWDPLRETYRQSLVDLAALRFSPVTAGARSLPAAGLPWFMTMFGRDSIFTSLQALPFTPELAARARDAAGNACGRLPRRGPRPDSPRDALRRDDGVRGAAALAVLRLRRRNGTVRRAAR